MERLVKALCVIGIIKVNLKKEGIKIKAYCKFCGIHFPDDFEKTLLPPCNFWGEHGLSNIDKDIKKEVWEWLFSAPIDKLNVLYKMDMPITFNANPMVSGGGFEDIVVNWKEMNEEEQQEFQRNWFKDRLAGKPMPITPIHYGGIFNDKKE